jgi:hypothetical protein
LIDARGEVVSKLEYGHRQVGFSTTGELVYVGPSCGFLECAGDRIDLYALDGRLLRTLEPGPFWQSIVLGNGSDLILSDDHGIRRVHHGGRSYTPWALRLPLRERFLDRSTYLAPDKMLVFNDLNALTVVDFNGVVVYHYDAEQLAGESPDGDVERFKIVNAQPGPQDRLWLTRRDGDYLVDLESGLMHPVQVDRTPPAGYPQAQPLEVSGHLVFVGQHEMAVRPLPSPALSPAD